jgi:hypothetical protein
MDFINPRKQRRLKIQLIIGYFLIAIAVALATLVMLFWAYGYSIGKNGQIVQNGLVFISSNPNPAEIYVNNVLNPLTTNTKLQLPAGNYNLRLNRSGYRPWSLNTNVLGGSVLRLNYPLLFPLQLTTTEVGGYSSLPGIITQTPDNHYLLVQEPVGNTFDRYDLSNPKAVASTRTALGIPTTLLTDPSEAASWKVVGWASDNQHVLLDRTYSTGSEYILLDIQDPASSINLTKTLGLGASTTLALANLKYDQYYLFDSTTGVLSQASLGTPQPTTVLSGVINYASYGTQLVYLSSTGAQPGNVNVEAYDGSKSYSIRSLPISQSYLLDIINYSGNWYVACGSPASGEVYIYMNPTTNQPSLPLVPVDILKVANPNYLAFSPGGQYIFAEGGSSFAVYDAMNNNGYTYTLKLPAIATAHADWLDSAHLDISVNNVLKVWDYDGNNLQNLEPSINGTPSFLDPSSSWSYTLAPENSPTAPYALTSTALRIPADQ